MPDVKRRRTANLSAKTNEDQDKEQAGFVSKKSTWVDLPTVSGLLSLTVCVVLTWFLFQQSTHLAAVDEKYNLLKQEAVKCQAMENKITVMSEKCEKTLSVTEHLEDNHIIAQMKNLQEEVNTMKLWSKRLLQEEQLKKNLTSLLHAITQCEESTASITKDFSIKIAAVKTDIRRISGLEADVTLLVENLHTLEDKVDKVEKATIQSIGNFLTDSIDRTTELRNTASENTRQIEGITKKISELHADFNKQSNKLLDLESDRVKVFTTVAFANDLKPRVYNLKKDLAHLEPILDELTLRIGMVLKDLLERQKEIAFLNKKLNNLMSVQAEVKMMTNELTNISGPN